MFSLTGHEVSPLDRLLSVLLCQKPSYADAHNPLVNEIFFPVVFLVYDGLLIAGVFGEGVLSFADVVVVCLAAEFTGFNVLDNPHELAVLVAVTGTVSAVARLGGFALVGADTGFTDADVTVSGFVWNVTAGNDEVAVDVVVDKCDVAEGDDDDVVVDDIAAVGSFTVPSP